MSSTEDTEKNKPWYNSYPTFMVVAPVVVVILILGTIRLFTSQKDKVKTFYREDYAEYGIPREAAENAWGNMFHIPKPDPEPEADAEPEEIVIMSGGFDILSTIGGNTKANIKVLVGLLMMIVFLNTWK